MRKIDLKAEQTFENLKVSGNSPRKAQGKFYWATDLEKNRHDQKSLSVIAGKTVLEIGCSSGVMAAKYSQRASHVTGVDISDEGIEKARQRDIPNARFECCDAHALPFGDNSFDVVIVNSLLHHLDLKASFEEISRVLNAQGVLIYREPLGTNPLFQLYRSLTPASRTEDERPFTFADLRLFRQYFNLVDMRWFGFFSLASAFHQKEWLREKTTALDHLLSKTPLRYFFWQISGVARKSNKTS